MASTKKTAKALKRERTQMKRRQQTKRKRNATSSLSLSAAYSQPLASVKGEAVPIAPDLEELIRLFPDTDRQELSCVLFACGNFNAAVDELLRKASLVAIAQDESDTQPREVPSNKNDMETIYVSDGDDEDEEEEKVAEVAKPRIVIVKRKRDAQSRKETKRKRKRIVIVHRKKHNEQTKRMGKKSDSAFPTVRCKIYYICQETKKTGLCNQNDSCQKTQKFQWSNGTHQKTHRKRDKDRQDKEKN
eukprot:TRINITY_DN4186_c0_g1_i2.p1 TRINITY_DN4186_c0_g1~~TRINITY_DN4186_c0_g1_i2.p1  ORF type:complete len:275 (+),score=69.66 TRINITY_DN4186_c0_g1_i2:90-827(+)